MLAVLWVLIAAVHAEPAEPPLVSQDASVEAPPLYLARQFDTIEVALPSPEGSFRDTAWVFQANSHYGAPWSAPVPGDVYQGHRVGDPLTVWDLRDGSKVPEACRIRSFIHRVVEWSNMPADAEAGPNCGRPQTYAQLTCSGKKVGVYNGVRYRSPPKKFLASPGAEAVSSISLVPSIWGEDPSRDPLPSRLSQSKEIQSWTAEIHSEYGEWSKNKNLGKAGGEDWANRLSLKHHLAHLKNHPDLSLVTVWGTAGDYNYSAANYLKMRFGLWDGERFFNHSPDHQSLTVTAVLTVSGRHHFVVVTAGKTAILSGLSATGVLYSDLYDTSCAEG